MSNQENANKKLDNFLENIHTFELICTWRKNNLKMHNLEYQSKFENLNTKSRKR